MADGSIPVGRFTLAPTAAPLSCEPSRRIQGWLRSGSTISPSAAELPHNRRRRTADRHQPGWLAVGDDAAAANRRVRLQLDRALGNRCGVRTAARWGLRSSRNCRWPVCAGTAASPRSPLAPTAVRCSAPAATQFACGIQPAERTCVVLRRPTNRGRCRLLGAPTARLSSQHPPRRVNLVSCAANFEQDVYVWNADTNHPTGMISLGEPPVGDAEIGLSPETSDGKVLAWRGYGVADEVKDRKAFVWDLAAQKLDSVLPTKGYLTQGAISPNGERAVTVSYYGGGSNDTGRTPRFGRRSSGIQRIAAWQRLLLRRQATGTHSRRHGTVS